MNRSYSSKAIILSIKAAGENNSNITLLTENKGIIFATLYGGPKSKMKSLVSQFNTGTIWLYENQEKKQIKITDFEVLKYHESFSTNLFKMYAASLASEIAIKTHCLGSLQSFFSLFSGFLDGMELCTEEQSRLGLIRFLWRIINISGLEPQIECCSDCNSSFTDKKFEFENENYYNLNDNNFICLDCIKNAGLSKTSIQSKYIPVKNSIVRYLIGINNLTPQQARNLQINKEDFYSLKNFIYFMIEKLFDLKLNSLQIGMGIL